jgi:putative signal transducing protein
VHHSDLVTVFESSDAALLALAKAALDDAGIRYVAEGEGLQDLFGMGRLFSGYNLITGSPRIRVTAENAERARELLDQLDS